MPKVKGKGKHLLARFDGKGKKNHAVLKECNGLVLISIKDKKECTGEYFLSTAIQAIQTFGNTTFLMVDRAYWHNLKNHSEKSSDELMDAAIQLGNDWFKSNESTFLTLLDLNIKDSSDYEKLDVDQKIDLINSLAKTRKKNFKIIRWAEWLNNGSTYQDILKYYAVNETLQEAINETAKDYASRHIHSDNQLGLETSKDYLLEECYPVMKIGAELGHHYIVYPGEISPAMLETWRFFVSHSYPDKMLWLRVSFRKTNLNYTKESIISADELFNTNHNENLFSQNKHLFFAMNSFQKRIADFPAQKQQKLLSLAHGFLFLLGKDDKGNTSKIDSNLMTTFNTFSEILLSATNENNTPTNDVYTKTLSEKTSSTYENISSNSLGIQS